MTIVERTLNIGDGRQSVGQTFRKYCIKYRILQAALITFSGHLYNRHVVPWDAANSNQEFLELVKKLEVGILWSSWEIDL
jgi:hypothetical protein